MGIELDVRTLTLSYIVVAVTFGVGLLIYAQRHRQFRGVRLVALGFFAIGSGFEFIGLRGEIPLFLSIPVANSLIFGGRCAVLIGIAYLIDAPNIRSFAITYAILTSAIFTLMCVFTYVEFNVNNRIISFSVFYAMITALGALLLLWGRAAYGRGMARTLACILLFVSAYHAFRVIWTLDAAELSTFMEAGFVHALSISLSQFMLLLAAVGVIWIVADGLQHELRQLALTDPLTQCLNRRAFDERQTTEWARAVRRGQSVSVIAVDIDHFKAVNDRLGHDAGDAVLQAVAARLRREVRADDVVARFGGEEFVVLLADTEREAAQDVAEKLRAAIAAEPVALSSGPPVPVTASFGVAGGRADRDPPEALLKAADEALYAAKDAGRNRVIVTPGETG